MMRKVKLQCQWDYFQYRSGWNIGEKDEFIGKYYLALDVLDVEKNITEEKLRKIIDVEYISRPHYIYDGLALLLDNGYWRFGCNKKYIRPKENRRGEI